MMNLDALKALLEYWLKEATKAVEKLELEGDKGTLGFFRFSYFFGDVIEFEGAAVAAYKLDPQFESYLRKARSLQSRALKVRDKLDSEKIRFVLGEGEVVDALTIELNRKPTEEEVKNFLDYMLDQLSAFVGDCALNWVQDLDVSA